MMVRLAILAALVAGCDYTSFKDCAIACTADSGCPDGLSCGREGRCRIADTTASCSELEDADPSCSCSDAITLSCPTGPTTCALGCVDDPAAPARCRRLTPSNGVGLDQLADVDTPISIAAGSATFDTDTGAITGALARAPGTGADAGIGYAQTASIGVFTLHALTVAADATILFKGTRAVAFVVETTATIDGLIDATGGTAADRSSGGPGGGNGGGVVAASGCGPGGAGFHSTADNLDAGGGGGAGATPGAAGGGATAAHPGGASGVPCLNATAEPLVGGGGGGTGGQGNATVLAGGGGGGGAIQITALDRISVAGRINAGGAGGGGGAAGDAGTNAAAGAGGGGGGSILLESIAVTVTGTLAANGGGGGGAGIAGTVGGNGNSGAASDIRAPGGTSAGTGAGAGGLGAASTRPAEVGALGTSNGGGGGGGAGVVYVRTSRAPELATAVVSPPPGTGPVHME